MYATTKRIFAVQPGLSKIRHNLDGKGYAHDSEPLIVSLGGVGDLLTVVTARRLACHAQLADIWLKNERVHSLTS